MKILTIKFKNINNLKGENVISFSDDPLKSAGIFAITGPTGSGKSTLLDVITLALFNRIPRFKGTISKSSIEGLGSVVTHHTDEAEATITYEIHNQKYTSSWTVGKTRTGNFKDYEMFIYDANGTPLDLKKSEVPAKNEDIIGLKYDQFVKSIILSQGQFAKFLRADKSERGQLLENLTGASIYRKISIAAYEKYKIVKDEVALEKDRLENIQVLNDEDRKLIQEQIEINGASKVKLDLELEKYNLAKQVKSDIERMSNALGIKNKEKANLANEIEQYREKLQQLATFDKLSPILGELTRYQDAKKNQKILFANVEKHEESLSKSEASRKLVIAEMSDLTKKTITVDNFNVEMSTFEKEVHSLNQDISHKQKSGIETRKRINSKAQSYRIEIDPKAGPNQAIPALKEKLSTCDKAIVSAGFDLEIALEKVNKSKEQAAEDLNALNQLLHAYEHEAISKERKEKALKDFSHYQDEELKYAPLVASIHNLIQTTKENITLLEKQKQNALLIAKLTDHRSRLTEGEPCPLCGALDHPYSEHHPQQDTDLSSDVQKAKAKLKEHEVEYAECNRKLTQNQASKKLIEEQIKLHDEELEKATKEQQVKQSAYKGSESKEPDRISNSIKKEKEKVDQLSHVANAIQSRAVLKEMVLDFEELKEILAEYGRLEKQLKEKYIGNDISRDCNVLQDKLVNTNTQIATLVTVLENEKINLSQTEKYLATATKTLDAQVKKMGFDSIEETAAFIISEDELKSLKSKKVAFDQKRTTIETEISTLNENIGLAKKRDRIPTESLAIVTQFVSDKSNEREALIKSIGEKTAILQKDDQERERIKSKEDVLKKLQEKLNKWTLLNKLIGEKTGNKFANFAQGLTLQNLLVYANKRLQKLSDRYLLDKPIKDGALTVIDQYQGNIQRSVATLSGGESFLISLALALSLSDMASKNVNLESLFIDEGFGTLDQESLDVAMNTLEKLQTESQKTVGVISHVEALKERIHVQIKLEKNAQGYGSLSVVG